VYGGGNIGLMGAIAETVSEGLGPSAVLGVIPSMLMDREVSGTTIGECRVVDNMHTRKAEMAEAADAFVALPGGFGTLEEILEAITWLQLGYHQKPVGFLNMNGFYDGLLTFFDHCVTAGFVR
jgi:cytokinin riboside 5'-monophosphate phosphoribohydrolase